MLHFTGVAHHLCGVENTNTCTCIQQASVSLMLTSTVAVIYYICDGDLFIIVFWETIAPLDIDIFPVNNNI